MMMLLHHLAGDHTTLEVMQEEIEVHLLGQAYQFAGGAAIPQSGGAGAAGSE